MLIKIIPNKIPLIGSPSKDGQPNKNNFKESKLVNPVHP